MTSPLSAIVRRAPVSCTPETPMRQVLETMNSLGIGSMVAVDPQQRPLGIFTLHDVLSRVTLPNLDLNTPFSAVMSPDPVTLPPHALAYEAALVMARHGFRHILVEEQGKLIGLLSEKDLFTLQRVGLRQLSGVIRKAADLDTLKHAAEDIRQLAHNMLAQGITAEQLTQIISTLNDLLTTRIIEMELEADSAARAVEFCWLALGSEGRLEQTLNTDQDNGILFSVPEGQDAESIRNVMLPFAKRINLALAECGFPLCGGEVMASNPKWCLSLSEWKNTFDKWIYHGAPMDLLHSTIFFDFRPMFGAVRMAEELREWLAEAAAKNTRFLHQLAVNALRNKPPLGIVRDFVTSDGMIDLKMNGITPFVDAARIFSLAHGVSATNTLQRLRDAGEKLRMSAQDIDALCDAFLYIQLLRLRLHHSQCQAGEKLTNKVDPETLNALDSRILREAFRQARKLQTKLALDYQV
jgi:CBS domain-containing protein